MNGTTYKPPGEVFSENNFDLIRLFAASQVVIVHALHHLGFDQNGPITELLRIFPGVPIFFVVSGFLISASYERSRNLKKYFVNRFLRIFPALWVCLLMSIALSWSILGFPLLDIDFFLWFLTQLTMFQFYHPVFLSDFGIGVLNGSLWTIPVELQFYLFLPVMYLVFRLTEWNAKSIVVGLLILIVINRINVHSMLSSPDIVEKVFNVSLLPYLYIFILGILLQRNLNAIKPILVRYVWIILSVYILVALIGNSMGFHVYGNSINPVSTVLLSLLVIGFGYYRFPSKSPLRGVDISYGIYIYHMPIINFMIEIDVFTNGSKLMISIVTTTVAALLSWFLVESPALRIKKSSNKIINKKSESQSVQIEHEKNNKIL